MRFTLSSSALNNRLQMLSKVINPKNSLPILDYFLFDICNNLLYITASDSENVMKTSVELDECDGDCKFAVPNRTILDAVKELPEQPLTFEVNTLNYTINISYQNGAYNFTAQSAEEYPITQEISEGASNISIGSSILNDNINRTLFALSLIHI